MGTYIGNFILGLIGIATGILITYKAYYINHHLLFLGWAERKWGPGYGTIAYRWIGVALIVASIFVLIGQWDIYGSISGQNAIGGSPSSGSGNNFGTPAQSTTNSRQTNIAP